MVLSTLSHFTRDLAPVRTASAIAPMSGTGASPAPGRRPATPARIVACRKIETAARLVADLTPEQEIETLALLDLVAERRAATIDKSRAYKCRENVAHNVAVLSADRHPSPARRRHLAALIEMHRLAGRDHENAASRLDKAHAAERRALGLPAARPKRLNASRHRTARGHRRSRRLWDRPISGKPVHAAVIPSDVDLIDLGETGAIYFHGAGAHSFGPTMAATVNLAADTDRRARRSGKPAAWLLERVTRRLEQALGHPVPVALAMEVNGSGLLHGHLILGGVAMTDAKIVRAALKLAGGKGYCGKQVVIKPHFDSGWCSYIGRDFLKSWPWASRVAATADLRTAAEVAFREVMAFIANPGKHSESK